MRLYRIYYPCEFGYSTIQFVVGVSLEGAYRDIRLLSVYQGAVKPLVF